MFCANNSKKMFYSLHEKQKEMFLEFSTKNLKKNFLQKTSKNKRGIMSNNILWSTSLNKRHIEHFWYHFRKLPGDRTNFRKTKYCKTLTICFLKNFQFSLSMLFQKINSNNSNIYNKLCLSRQTIKKIEIDKNKLISQKKRTEFQNWIMYQRILYI
jgi:hypothetical protein